MSLLTTPQEVFEYADFILTESKTGGDERVNYIFDRRILLFKGSEFNEISVYKIFHIANLRKRIIEDYENGKVVFFTKDADYEAAKAWLKF